MSIILALLVFSVLVLFHEFGHFLLAKKNGIGVTEFSLGLGPRILSFEKGGTKYSWKLIPFGGSCAMVGEDSEEEGENSFNSKSVWARISSVAFGKESSLLPVGYGRRYPRGFSPSGMESVISLASTLPLTLWTGLDRCW